MLSAACRVLCESLRQPERAGHHAVDPPTEVVHCYICYMQLCVQVQGYPPSVGPHEDRCHGYKPASVSALSSNGVHLLPAMVT